MERSCNAAVTTLSQAEGVGERTGLLVIRAWREVDSPVPLRAEIRLARDVSEGFQRRLTVTEAEQVTRIVLDWLAVVLENSQV